MAQRNNRLLTNENNNFNTNSLFINKMNIFKKSNLSINNQNSFNKIMKKISSNKTPKKILFPYKNKKLNIVSYTEKKEKPENFEKERKNKRLLLNQNIKELLFNKNVKRNKSHKINYLVSLRESKKLLSPLTYRNVYDFRNMVNIPDISKNFLIKYNSRDLKKKVTIFSYKDKMM